MAEQGPTAGLEPAYTRYVSEIARSDPDRAIALLEDIRDGEARRAVLTNIGIGKMADDPEAGLSWMEDENVPPDVREKVLDRFGKIREYSASRG
jgi:hypothetical protein